MIVEMNTAGSPDNNILIRTESLLSCYNEAYLSTSKPFVKPEPEPEPPLIRLESFDRIDSLPHESWHLLPTDAEGTLVVYIGIHEFYIDMQVLRYCLICFCHWPGVIVSFTEYDDVISHSFKLPSAFGIQMGLQMETHK